MGHVLNQRQQNAFIKPITGKSYGTQPHSNYSLSGTSHLHLTRCLSFSICSCHLPSRSFMCSTQGCRSRTPRGRPPWRISRIAPLCPCCHCSRDEGNLLLKFRTCQFTRILYCSVPPPPLYYSDSNLQFICGGDFTEMIWWDWWHSYQRFSNPLSWKFHKLSFHLRDWRTRRCRR